MAIDLDDHHSYFLLQANDSQGDLHNERDRVYNNSKIDPLGTPSAVTLKVFRLPLLLPLQIGCVGFSGDKKEQIRQSINAINQIRSSNYSGSNTLLILMIPP